MTTIPQLATAHDLTADAHARLETGWDRFTPDGDNIVLDAARAMAAGYSALAAAGAYPHAVIDHLGLHVADAGSPSPFGNTVHLTSPLADDDVLGALHHLTESFGARQGGPFLLFSPWPTPDLGAHGLMPVGHPPLMVRWYPEPASAPSDVDVRRVTTAEELVEFERTLIEAYPVRELLPHRPGCFLRPAALETHWRFYVARVAGQPVGCAAGYVTDAVTLVEMVATRPEARHRGVGAALTAAAAAAAGDAATGPAVLIASDSGKNVYADLGFRSITRFTLWIGSR